MQDQSSKSDTAPTWLAVLNLARQYRLLTVILFAQMPMLLIHLQNMWRRPQHQSFPIVIIAVILLFFTRLERLTFDNESKLRTRLSNLLFVSSILIFAVSVTLVFSPWLATVSFLLSCGAAFMVLQDRYAVPNLFGIWLLLCLLLPIPGSQAEQLATKLQRVTTVASGTLLELINVPNSVEGATLIVPGRQILVEETHVGIISMMSVMTCCILLAVWANRAWLHSILLVLNALVLISATNIFQIVMAALVDYRFSLDLLSGWKHDVLGVALFSAGLLIMLSTDQLLKFCLDPVEAETTYRRESQTRLLRLYNWFMQFGPVVDFQGVDFRDRSVTQPVVRTTLIVAAGVFACLGITSVYKISTRRIAISDSVIGESSNVQMLNANSLPNSIGEWKEVGYSPNRNDSLFPQKNELWNYQNEYSVLQSQFEKANDLPFQLRKRDSHDAMLMYGMFDEPGKRIDPPQVVTTAKIAGKCFRMVSERLIQIQGWTTSLKSIIDEHRRTVE